MDCLCQIEGFAGFFDRLWFERNGNGSCRSQFCNRRQLPVFGPRHHSSSQTRSSSFSSVIIVAEIVIFLFLEHALHHTSRSSRFPSEQSDYILEDDCKVDHTPIVIFESSTLLFLSSFSNIYLQRPTYKYLHSSSFIYLL